jgi:hypothetical protein
MNSTTSDVTATAPKLLIQVLIVQEIPEVNGVSKWPQQEICSDHLYNTTGQFGMSRESAYVFICTENCPRICIENCPTLK